MTTGSVNASNADHVTYAVQGKSAPAESGEAAAAATAAAGDSAEISALAKELAANSELDKVDTSQSAEQARLASREAKDGEGARFDAVLADLRSKYSEQEAISRFNDFMRSEGYEIQENVADRDKPSLGGKLYGGRINASPLLTMGSMAFALGKPIISLADVQSLRLSPGDYQSTPYSSPAQSAPRNLYGRSTREASTASFNTHSTVTGVMENGEMKYTQSTWASYNASINSYFDDAQEFWKNRNVDELSEQAGFDVGAYVDNLSVHWGKAFAAESVNTDLGSIMSGILAEAGVALGAGENLVFNMSYSDGGRINGLFVYGNFGDAALRETMQSAIDQALARDPSILKRFVDEYNSVEEFDVGQLAGTYANGLQSNKYIQQRQFVMSGDQPSTVVMGSGLDFTQTGYTYVKKLSDTFDADADAIAVRGRDYTTKSDPEEYARMKQFIDEVKDSRTV